MIFKNLATLAVLFGLSSAAVNLPKYVNEPEHRSHGDCTPTHRPTHRDCSSSSSSSDSDCECHHTTRHHDCSSSSDDECTTRHEFCCETQTICKTIDNKPCQVLIFPCPTNTTQIITTTITVAPTSAAAAPIVAPVVAAVVAPTSAAAPVCTPCTTFVTQTTVPSLVCTTMIFCDIADQSDNCVAQNNQVIESIASKALRSGGQVFINGQLVVFKNEGSGSGNSTVVSGSTVLTVSGQQANDASPQVGLMSTVAGGLGLLAVAVFFL